MALHLKAIRGVPWTIASYSASRVVTVATTIVLARIVSPADFGLMALAVLALNLLAFVKDMGLGGTLVLRQDLDRRGQGTVLTLMMAVSLVLAVLAAACAPAVAGFFDEPRLTGVLMAMSGMLAISGFSSFYEVLLQRTMEFRARFVALMLQAVAIAVVSIGLAVLGAGVWSLVAGQIAGLAIFGVAAFALAPYRVAPALDIGQVPSLFGTSSGFLAQNVANFARQNLDYAVVGRTFGASVVGFYSMAYRLGDLTYWAIADPVARVTFPSFARSRSEGAELGRAFLGVARLVALISCPLGILLSATAEPLTAAFFGDRWLPMVGPLAVLGVWAAVRPIETTFNWLLNSIDQARVVGLYSFAVLVVLAPAFWLAATRGSITTVAVVVLCDTIASLVFMAVMVARRAHVPYLGQWRSVWQIAVACAPTWLVARALTTLDLPSGVALMLALIGGSLTYLVVLRILSPTLLREAAAQIGRTMGRGPAADTAADS